MPKIKSNIEVIVIDDDLHQRAPLIIELSRVYEKVQLFKDPQEGLSYVNDNLDKKLIVILDIRFGPNQIDGNIVFERIRHESLLVPIIIWSANKIGQDISSNLVKFINEQAFAYLLKTSLVEDILLVVDKAAKSVESRVDAALQEWISLQPLDARTSPYLKTADGQTLNLNDVLREVRLQTPKGKKFEKRLIDLTIEMLMGGKRAL